MSYIPVVCKILVWKIPLLAHALGLKAEQPLDQARANSGIQRISRYLVYNQDTLMLERALSLKAEQKIVQLSHISKGNRTLQLNKTNENLTTNKPN